MTGRVLHVIPSVSLVHGGPSAAIRLIERALAETEWRTETATTTDDGRGHRLLRPEGVIVREEAADRRYFAKNTEFYKVALSFVPWIRRHVRDYDAVHIHGLFSFLSVAAARAASSADVPYIVRPLGALNQYGVTRRRPWLKRYSLRSIEGPVLRNAAAVHFTADAEYREASTLGLTFNPVVIPLGYDLRSEDSHGLRVHKESSNCEGQRILFLSRLDPIKNLEGLIEAVGRLLRAGRAVRLDIAGDGAPEYVARLKDRAALHGLGEHVRWLGHVSGSAKTNLLESADIFVLPSLSENFGMAVLEAMASRLPCVVGRGVALAASIESAGAGVAVDESPECIAAGIQRYLDSKIDRMRAGTAARDLVEREFSMTTMANKLVALYESVRIRA